MEIKYPFIIITSILLFVLVLLFTKKKSSKSKNSRKVANTSIIKNTPEFKNIIKKYRIVLYLIYVLVFIAVLANSVLSSRIIEEQTKKEDIYNRDIMLCMDVSGSVLELNAELVDSYKEIVSSLKGERFGISIFNTTSVLLVPLTDDYDYLSDALDVLSKSIDYTNNYEKYKDTDLDERLYLSQYIYKGTIVGADQRGSSLAGDGLASCVLDFPNLDEKRSRIIVYSTDNEIYGKQYIDVIGAAKLAKKNNITVYTIAPELTTGKDEKELQEATKIANGEYYVHQKGPTVKSIVDNIESKEKSLLKGNEKTIVTDYPQVPFIILLVSFFILIIIDKVVLSWLQGP